MLPSLSRVLVLAALTSLLLVVGLIGPASSTPAPDLPVTVSRTLSGLPADAKDARASRSVTSPIPFSMVGFDVPRGTDLQFRTSVDGKQWTSWTDAEIEPDEGPDATSAEGRAAARTMSAPVWVGEAAHLQTRSSGIAAAAKPSQVKVHVIDSSGLGRSWGRAMLDRLGAAWRGAPASAEAMTGQPSIVTRSQWGADEDIRRNNPSYGERIVAGFVHHTAGANDYSRDEADNVVRAVYSYHVQSRGWSDIGYNFLVDKYGTVYEGRYGGITRAVVGAHASGFNTNTFGVSLMGNFVNVRPPAAMVSALRGLLAWKYDLHHVNVAGTVGYAENGSGPMVTLDRLSGHRDVGSTSCPGGYAYSLLPGLRTSVAELQGAVILYPQASPRSLDVLDGESVEGPVRFEALLRPAGEWKIVVTDPDGVVVHTAVGSSRRIAHEWLPTGVRPGTYRYRITSPTRRAAVGWLKMVPPSISAAASPTAVRYRSNGMLFRSIYVRGTLYNNARWALRVIDPDGVRVSLTRGAGSTFSSVWAGPVVQPGRYEWRLVVDGMLRKTGPLYVYADRVDRIASVTTSAAAAAGISRRAFADGTAARAVVATTTDPGFAMQAGPVAGPDGPVLYTLPSRLSEPTLDELKRVLAPTATVYVLGGTSVISEAVVARLTLELQRPVVRIEGNTPTRTAAAASDVVTARTGARSALLVGGVGTGVWRQAVGASAAGTAKGQPVLLTDPSRLSPATRDALVRNGTTAVTIVGNGTTVSTAAAQQLPSSVTSVRRIAGSSGPRTAVMAARLLFGRVGGTAKPDDAYTFLNGERSDGWLRSLAAAPLVARTNAPLLFSNRYGLPDATGAYLENMAYSRTVLGKGTVLGNGDHVSGSTRTTLARLLQ